MSILIGQDLSHHNNEDIILKSADFIWIKATEGKTYTDPSVEDFLKAIAIERKDNLPVIGFYHYARPENGNKAEDEAKHYLYTIREHAGKCIYALDLEGDAFRVGDRQAALWANTFMDTVKQVTGARCFLYIGRGQYMAREFNRHINKTYPVWCANWDVTDIRGFKMWQVDSRPFDLDIWTGTLEELVQYAVR